MTEVTVFIIAGGKSSRMGQDKAFVEFDGETLLERMLRTARSVSTNVGLVGDPEKFAQYAPTTPDVFPARGPLGGIHAALRSSRTELNLMLAVDMPFVRTDFLRYLSEEAGAAAATVTVPQANGRLQPLCAVYRRDFADVAETALAKGENKVTRLFAPKITHIITQEDIERLEFPASMFDNLNTREDLESARTKNAKS